MKDILSEVGLSNIKKNPSMVLGDMVERLVKDAFMCIYQRKTSQETVVDLATTQETVVDQASVKSRKYGQGLI